MWDILEKGDVITSTTEYCLYDAWKVIPYNYVGQQWSNRYVKMRKPKSKSSLGNILTVGDL